MVWNKQNIGDTCPESAISIFLVLLPVSFSVSPPGSGDTKREFVLESLVEYVCTEVIEWLNMQIMNNLSRYNLEILQAFKSCPRFVSCLRIDRYHFNVDIMRAGCHFTDIDDSGECESFLRHRGAFCGRCPTHDKEVEVKACFLLTSSPR